MAVSLTSTALPALAADEGEIHIRKGVELRRQGRDKEAAEHFRTAYEISHTARAAAQLALCEQAIGEWLSGEQHLSEALLSQSDAWVNSKRATLEEARRAGRSHLAAVKIEGSPPGAMVSVGDRTVGRLPISEPVWVQPDKVQVTGRSDGYEPMTREIAVQKGETIAVSLNLPKIPVPAAASDVVPLAATVEATPDSAPARSSWRPIAAWSSFGLAAASLGAGVVGHVQREGRIKDFNDPAGDCFRDGGAVVGGDDCEKLDGRISSATTLMWIGYVGAALFGAAGAVLWMGGGDDSEPSSPVACRLVPGLPASTSASPVGIAQCSGRF